MQTPRNTPKTTAKGASLHNGERALQLPQHLKSFTKRGGQCHGRTASYVIYTDYHWDRFFSFLPHSIPTRTVPSRALSMTRIPSLCFYYLRSHDSYSYP